jgi:hypothetical protein
MLELALSPTASRIRQLERPQKVVCLLEIWADSVNLVDQILDRFNTIFAEGISDECIVGEGNAGTVDFTIAALVDEVADRFEVGFSVGNVGLNDLQHFLCGFGESDKHTVVDLEQSEKLQDFPWFRCNFVDTIMSIVIVKLRYTP